MRIRDLLNESDVRNQSLSKEKRDRLRNVLSSMFGTIQRFERNGKLELRDDKEKIEMLKDTIHSMIKEEDRKKVIRGDG